MVCVCGGGIGEPGIRDTLVEGEKVHANEKKKREFLYIHVLHIRYDSFFK